MDILYLLIPLSVVLVLLIIGIFAWSLHSGQFDDLEREGERILDRENPQVDDHQSDPEKRPGQSETLLQRGDRT